MNSPVTDKDVLYEVCLGYVEKGLKLTWLRILVLTPQPCDLGHTSSPL